LGKYTEAFQSFTPFEEDIREAPIRDSFLFGKARSLGKLGRFQEALDTYDRVIHEFPASE